MQAHTIDLDGPVHYLDFGGSGQPIVLVHGLGGAAINWMRVGDALSGSGRVVALDLAGFGRTPPERRATHVDGNRALLDRFVAEVCGEPAVLMGNSMGAMVSLLEAGRHPSRVAGLVLVAAALPPASPRLDPRFALRGLIMLSPVLGGIWIRRTLETSPPEHRVDEVLDLVGVERDQLPPEVYAAHVQLTSERDLMPWTPATHLEAARSLLFPLFAPRFRRLVDRVASPTLVLHGTDDRLVPVESARRLAGMRPDWPLVELPGVGHVPMLSAPDTFLAATEGFFADVAQRRAARPV